jgi:hypothetical protein
VKLISKIFYKKLNLKNASLVKIFYSSSNLLKPKHDGLITSVLKEFTNNVDDFNVMSIIGEVIYSK